MKIYCLLKVEPIKVSTWKFCSEARFSILNKIDILDILIKFDVETHRNPMIRCVILAKRKHSTLHLGCRCCIERDQVNKNVEKLVIFKPDSQLIRDNQVVWTAIFVHEPKAKSYLFGCFKVGLDDFFIQECWSVGRSLKLNNWHICLLTIFCQTLHDSYCEQKQITVCFGCHIFLNVPFFLTRASQHVYLFAMFWTIEMMCSLWLT